MPPKIARFDTGEEPIDGYVLVEFLGRGQFGEVWKARDKASGRLLAVKIIDLTFSPTALKELRAFKLVKNLNHPNLVPIFTARLKNRRDKEVDFDKADGLPKGDLKELVIVMGLGEKSLSQRLKELNVDGTPPEERQGLPVPELIRFMRGAAKGIDFLNNPDHGLSGGTGDGPIIHCDIKPENLMIVAGEVQIADCGVAVIISPDMRQTRAAGSPAYSAPELSGNKPGPGTDQYALAISYYELRTGRLPFPEEASLQQIILAHALGDLDFSAPVLTDAERDVLRRATARVPADRFETCDEFIEELSGLPDIRAAIKAHRRSSTHLFPSRGSDDFRLPGTGHTPVGDGTGTPGPRSDPFGARQSDPVKSDFPPRATPAVSPAAEAGPARPGSAPPRPKDGAIDYDVAAQDEPVPRPDTASWKEFAAAPPGREGGTLHFELPESKPGDQPTVPTPWLPFPAQRTPPGPPPGLIATTVIPDILPQPGPVPEPPAVRETALPTPSTDTPRDGAGRPLGPPVPSVSGMPVNPDDPLGKRYAAAEPDTIIRGIIAAAPGVKDPPPRAAEPAAPAARKPDAPAKKKKAAPPPKRAADESLEGSKPAWFKEAVAEEARKQSGPVPEKKKPTPVFLPAIEAKQSGPKAPAKPAPTGNWRDTASPSAGGNGKLIAMIAAGVVAFAGVGAGIFYAFNRTSDGPGQPSAKAPDTTGRDPTPPPPTNPGPPTPPTKRDSDVTNPPITPPTPPVKTDAVKYAEAVESLKTIDPGKDLPAYAAKLRTAFAAFAGKPDFKAKLAAAEVAKAKPQAHRWEVWRVVTEAYPAAELFAAPEAAGVRKDVAGWRVADLQDAFAKETEPALTALAVPAASADLVKKATGAVGDWWKKADDAKTEFPAEWPDAVLPGGVEAVVKTWHAAATEPTTDPAKRPKFAELKKLARQEAAPALPAVVAFEYFRLAPAGEPIDDLRRARDNTAAWENALSQDQRKSLAVHFQGKLASLVRTRLQSDKPDFEQIARDCGSDAANGWTAAAAAEAALLRNSPDADSRVRSLAAAASELEAFRRYLSALADARANNRGAAADALADVYTSPPDLLKTTARRNQAVDVLLKAAREVADQNVQDGRNPYRSGPAGQAAVRRLRAADKVAQGGRPEVALHLYLAATAAGEPGLDEVASRAAVIDARSLRDRAEAEAGLAFFKLRAASGAAADRLTAYAGAVRCAVQLLDLDRAGERTDEADRVFGERAVKAIAGQYLEPGLRLGREAVPSGPGREALSELVVWKSSLRGFDYYIDQEASRVEVADRLTREIENLLGPADARDPAAVATAARKNPVLAEALACRAYVTLYRFARRQPKDVKDVLTGDDPDAARLWQRLRADAEAAVGCVQARPFLAHLTLAVAGYNEFRDDVFDAPAKFNRLLHKASIEEITKVANHFKAACDLFGNKKYQKSTVLFYRARFLFEAANTLAKSGRDSDLVRRYLTDARDAITEIEQIRATKRYDDLYQKGNILEDMAWLLRQDPGKNYAAALAAFKDGELWRDRSRLAGIAPADVARCTARGVMFGHLPRTEVNEALAGMRSFDWENARPSEKSKALFWQGVLEWVRGNPTGAGGQLQRVADELKDPATAPADVKEFTIRAHGLRGQIAITRLRRGEGGAEDVTVVAETLAAFEKLFADESTRKDFSHYAFITDYFRGWKAFQDGNKEDAAKHFRTASRTIGEMDQKYELFVEEPFPLLCVATELDLLGGSALTVAERDNRVRLLNRLRARFPWALTTEDAGWIDSVISKHRK